MADTTPSAPAPCEIRLPTRHLLDKTRAAYDEGRDVLWFASRHAEIRHGMDALGDWRPNRMVVLREDRRRIAWLAHNVNNPPIPLLTYTNTLPSWSRRCRMCGWTEDAWGWQTPDEQTAQQQAGTFTCGTNGCVSRAHDWAPSKP